jgi:hypothetical protein
MTVLVTSGFVGVVALKANKDRMRGEFATTIRCLGGEGVGLRAGADVIVEELDAPSSAGLVDDLLTCTCDDRESEGDHTATKFVHGCDGG